jgi:hypothetical protein
MTSTTSRFNILKNATNSISSISIKNNSLYSSSHNNNNFKTNRFVSKHVNEERNKKQKDDAFIKSLDSLTSFPILQTTTKTGSNINSEKTQPITFIEAMKAKNTDSLSEKITSDDDDDDDVPPGCVCIKYDKVTKKTIWIYGKNTASINNEKKTLEHSEDPRVIFQRLVNLHQGRKYDHISKWGIDEYEKMFLYQNYDHEYFDKLDEQIEKDMEKYYQNTSYNLHNYYNDSDNDN